MSILVPNIKFIKSGDTKATDIVIKLIVITNLLMVGSALFFTFFE